MKKHLTIIIIYTCIIISTKYEIVQIFHVVSRCKKICGKDHSVSFYMQFPVSTKTGNHLLPPPPPPYSPPPLLIGQFLYAPPKAPPTCPNKAKNNTLQLIAGNAFSTIISNMVKESANIADFEETTTFSNDLKSSVWDMAC